MYICQMQQEHALACSWDTSRLEKFTSQPDGEWLDNLYQMLKSWLYFLSGSAAWQLQLTGNATQSGRSTVGQNCFKLS